MLSDKADFESSRGYSAESPPHIPSIDPPQDVPNPEAKGKPVAKKGPLEPTKETKTDPTPKVREHVKKTKEEKESKKHEREKLRKRRR